MCHTKTETVSIGQVVGENKAYVVLLHVETYNPYTKVLGVAINPEKAERIMCDYKDLMPDDRFEIVETTLDLL